ncbi:MAG: hypothetical protein COC01_05380 [Bacteroidetes bacterium]|nr:DEAD/DEAH box helicase [Sphingobacteriaceae bacterium AH-315-L07]PCH67642.1 MAG: hypothetical protein COC01_05380 [Bacteroidota bacterium]
MNNFSKLGLSKSILEVLDKIGFETPTPVQEQAIPLLLRNNPTDFIGLAQTGTGKTAAFGLPLIDLIDSNNNSTQALIMAPTRELGQQIAKQLVDFSKNHRAINIEVVYGGAAIINQIRALKKPTQIVVATPGRLLDLIKRKAIHLNNVKYVVLDEADEMLNMGFKEDIDKILSHTLENRVTWLFSATMPPEIRRIIKKYMDKPLEVSINTEEKVNKDIEHKFVITKTSNKVPALRRFLDIQPDMRAIMFCRTKRETQQISDELGKMGYNVEALHGDLSQAQRDAAMHRFKTRGMQLLLATDVAARGIDVIDLTHVFHHTLPEQMEYYTHRSGRTARAGRKGTSLVFINPREERRIKEIERKVKITFEKIEVPSVVALKSSRINNWADLIINTKVDDQAEKILNELHDQFAHLDKEDILKRLITSQLDHLMGQNGEDSNLNEKVGARESRGGSRDKNGFHRYYINIGSIDGVTKGDIIHFLADVANIDRNHIGDLSLQKNCAYFDVKSEHDQGFSEKFNGVEVKGREIRVNRDLEGGGKRSKSSNSHGGYKGKKKHNRGKQDFYRSKKRRKY